MMIGGDGFFFILLGGGYGGKGRGIRVGFSHRVSAECGWMLYLSSDNKFRVGSRLTIS